MGGHTGAQATKTREKIMHVKENLEYFKSIASPREQLFLDAVGAAKITDNSTIIAKSIDKGESSLNTILRKYANIYPGSEFSIPTEDSDEWNRLPFNTNTVIAGVVHVPLPEVEKYVAGLINTIRNKPVETVEITKTIEATPNILVKVYTSGLLQQSTKDVVTVSMYPINLDKLSLLDLLKKVPVGNVIGITPIA